MLTAGELAAVDLESPLVVAFLARLRKHAPTWSASLVDLTSWCALLAWHVDTGPGERSQLFGARLALASYADRSTGLEIAEVVADFLDELAHQNAPSR